MESAGESSHSAETGTTLLQNILSTIEFYFSDINLSRNKFLAHKVLENPYVPVSLLLTFHKLQELTTDENLVIEAVKMSKMLHLTEDGTKVFRTTEIRPVDTIDEHLIYVENVPVCKDQEWLRQIFSAYGTVMYVSLPVYKQSRQNKGFAFVEFSSDKEAMKSFEAFQSCGLTIKEDIPPDDLLSIKTHEESPTEISASVNRKDLVNSVVETRDLAELGMKIMVKTEWKRVRNRFLNRIHAKKKLMKVDDVEVKEEGAFKEGCVLKLEKEKHVGNLDDFLAGIRMRPNGGIVFVTNKKKEAHILIRFNSAEKATEFLSPDLPHVTKIEGEEEEKYWENVYRIVTAKKQMKHEKWAERKREKRRARNAAARMLQNEFGEAEHETNFDSLLEQRQGDGEHEQNQVGKIIIDPNLRTKRKKKRDRNTPRVANKHIYFQDEEVEMEGKTDGTKGEDAQDCLAKEEKTNGEDIPDDKTGVVESEFTHEITLKREGDQLIDTPPCKKSLVTEI